VIEVVVPGSPPLLLNNRSPWYELHRLKKDWYAAVHYALLEQRAIPDEPLRSAIVHYTRYAPGREPDQVNLASSFKWVEDALVRSRVLMDDNPSVVTNFYHWERCRTREARVRIQVSPLPPLISRAP
jgi:hypothetical protein